MCNLHFYLFYIIIKIKVYNIILKEASFNLFNFSFDHSKILQLKGDLDKEIVAGQRGGGVGGTIIENNPHTSL